MDDAGVDERGLAEVQDHAVPTLERMVSLIAEAWRVRQIELSLEADGDDLVGLGDNANDSRTLDRKSTRLNSSHATLSRMPSSA